MYEQCFQFSSRPFTTTPFVKHYFAADEMQQSLDAIRMCVERGSGPAVVVGAAGTGKSLLLAMLEDQFRSQFNVVNLACARLDQRQDLLQSILFELQLPYRDMGEGELRLSLMDFLRPSEDCANGILLLVDEAHTLPAGLLDELRLITNFVRDGQPRVRLVMAGNTRLEETLNDPKLESFNQRIATRCYLSVLSQCETEAYIKEHIERADGVADQLFPTETCRKVHELANGLPRCINQVCDHALIHAATRGLTTISPRIVEEAWADVQHLPGMVSETTFGEAAAAEGQQESWTVIEFGSLDDETGPTQFESVVEEMPVNEFAAQAEPIESAEEIAESYPVVSSDTEMESFESDSLETEESVSEFDNEVVSIGRFEAETDTESSAFESSDVGSPRETFETEAAIGDDLNEVEAEVEETVEEIQEIQEESQTATTTVTNPFDEHFDDVEEVVDEYSPLVAQQNLSSLDVTSDDLNFIQSMDADSGGDSNSAEPVDTEVRNDDESICDSAIPVDEGLTVSADTVSTDSDSNDSSTEDSFHEHVTDVSSEEIERRAEEILQALSHEGEVSCETEQEPEESNGGEDSSEIDDLQESHRILQEIIEENQRVASQTKSEDMVQSLSHLDEMADESSSATTDEHDDRCDDKDMIIVSSSDETEPTNDPVEDSIPFPTTAVSKGRAERMDYQQLFEQLRSISND